MITRIDVNGFKSLNDFSLNINSGLNILVGPNGSGKTNIILFFEFVSNLVTHDLYTAITKAGGAGSIFSKSGEKDYCQSIDCVIYGCTAQQKNYVLYEYSFSIGISFAKDSVFFSKQKISMALINEFKIDYQNSNWDLVAELKDETGKINVSTLNFKKIPIRFYQEGNGNLQKLNEEYFSHHNALGNSLLRQLFLFEEISFSVFQDLKGGETFNIIPSKVRQPEDSANPPGVKKDGSGLANTLYAMFKPRMQNPMDFIYVFNDMPSISYDNSTLTRIIDTVKLANDSIVDISVKNDQFNNTLNIIVIIKGDGKNISLPLASMSDGTIKWITLITAILTTKEIFSIEEPENFLHPFMQSQIVEIMRTTFSNQEKESFIIMTTHSESLLNYSKPEELIIVSYTDGKTVAKRIKEPRLISNEIMNTGFGLGYYYIASALDNE